MIRNIDTTHRVDLESWVSAANQPESDFPVQNLPFGVFKTDQLDARVGTAIGDRIFDLRAAADAGLLSTLEEGVQAACRAKDLLPLMGQGSEGWGQLRKELSRLLTDGVERPRVSPCLVAASDATMLMPCRIRDYTDFYASVYHATNVGKLFRPDQPLLPNYKHVPIGYHGRASSIVLSGTEVRRPKGQTKGPNDDLPSFGACKLLDYELELGFFVGTGNALGRPVPAVVADMHLFGACVVNDWSARDIQGWEYQPLGPFLAKSFATSISPWVVTMEALAPFRGPVFERPEEDPQPLDYLKDGLDLSRAGVDITVEAYLSTAEMRKASTPPHRLSQGTSADLYWAPAQMLAHHSCNGCNMAPGDMFASGTVSGPDEDSLGSLLEITERGKNKITLPSGEKRTFLQDGDEVILRAFCEKEGYRRIGLGECRGIVTG